MTDQAHSIPAAAKTAMRCGHVVAWGVSLILDPVRITAFRVIQRRLTVPWRDITRIEQGTGRLVLHRKSAKASMMRWPPQTWSWVRRRTRLVRYTNVAHTRYAMRGLMAGAEGVSKLKILSIVSDVCCL
jgi:hypothetical protein